MTRKATLQRWHSQLTGQDAKPGATVSGLESDIEDAIANLTAEPESEPEISLGQAVQNNWQVIRAEAVPTVKAIAGNLAGRG